MIAGIIVLIIIILSVAQFYLKNSALTSFVLVACSLIAMTITFGYYEMIAPFLIPIGFLANYSYAIAFILVFILSLVILYIPASFLVGSAIDLGKITKSVTAILGGLVFGLIIGGIFVIFLSLLPKPAKIPYNRFPDTSSISGTPKNSLLNTDGIVTGLFSWISKSSMSSGKSFSSLNNGFLDKIHINRLCFQENISPLAGNNAVEIRQVKPQEDNRIIVDTLISDKAIKDGGAKDANNDLSMLLAQCRVLCIPQSAVNPDLAATQVIYPKGYVKNGNYSEQGPSKKITFQRDDIKSYKKYGRRARIQLVFKLPTGQTARYFQFKLNQIITLPKPTTEDIVEEEE